MTASDDTGGGETCPSGESCPNGETDSCTGGEVCESGESCGTGEGEPEDQQPGPICPGETEEEEEEIRFCGFAKEDPYPGCGGLVHAEETCFGAENPDCELAEEAPFSGNDNCMVVEGPDACSGSEWSRPECELGEGCDIGGESSSMRPAALIAPPGQGHRRSPKLRLPPVGPPRPAPWSTTDHFERPRRALTIQDQSRIWRALILKLINGTHRDR